MGVHEWVHRFGRRFWKVFRCELCRDYVWTRNGASVFLNTDDCPAGESRG